MEADSPRPSLTSDLDQTRYNPATRWIWPWPQPALPACVAPLPMPAIAPSLFLAWTTVGGWF